MADGRRGGLVSYSKSVRPSHDRPSPKIISRVHRTRATINRQSRAHEWSSEEKLAATNTLLGILHCLPIEQWVVRLRLRELASRDGGGICATYVLLFQESFVLVNM